MSHEGSILFTRSIPVRPELVEGQFSFCYTGTKERGFDKLSPNGPEVHA